MKRLECNNYLEKLMAFRDKHIIKIITGIRKCGKSTLMEIYQDALRSRGVAEEQIISVNLEDFDYRALRQPEQLHTYVKERIIPEKMTMFFWMRFSMWNAGPKS